MTVLALAGLVAFYGANHDMHAIAQRQGVTVPAGYTPIAHWDCDRLGEWGELTFTVDGQAYTYRVIIGDCTAPADVALVRSRNIIAEVPYIVAADDGFVERGLVPGRLVLYHREGPQWQ